MKSTRTAVKEAIKNGEKVSIADALIASASAHAVYMIGHVGSGGACRKYTCNVCGACRKYTCNVCGACVDTESARSRPTKHAQEASAAHIREHVEQHKLELAGEILKPLALATLPSL